MNPLAERACFSQARMTPFFATWRGWLDAARGEEADVAATVIARQYRGWQVP